MNRLVTDPATLAQLWHLGLTLGAIGFVVGLVAGAVLTVACYETRRRRKEPRP